MFRVCAFYNPDPSISFMDSDLGRAYYTLPSRYNRAGSHDRLLAQHERLERRTPLQICRGSLGTNSRKFEATR